MLLLSCSQDSNIVQDLTCVESEYEYVDILAFRFGGQSGSALVTFHVTAIVCLGGADSNECEDECLFCDLSSDGISRKRRSVDVDRAVKTKYYLEAGPYKFGKVDKKNQKGLCLLR